MKSSLSYLICCSERTGSTLLGNALIDTGIAGRPRSYFNRIAHFSPRIQQVLDNAKDDEGYLDRVIAAATTPNGVFGAKVHWEHFQSLIAKVERGSAANEGASTGSVLERLGTRLPDLRFIWLERRNAVARAISHYRAKKTNRWQLDSRWVTDETGGEGEPAFDFDEIDAFVRIGEVEEAHWREFFEREALSPLNLVYEEMIQDLKGTVRRVLEFLGISTQMINLPTPNLQRQADHRSREWEARYRQIIAEEGR